MSYQIYRGGDGRFLLRCSLTSGLVGFLICPLETELRRMFEYDFGSTENRDTLVNVNEFSELDKLSFFGIESLGFHDFDRCLQQESWADLWSLFLAEGKAIAYCPQSRPFSSTANHLLWQYTPANPQGSWKVPAWALYVNQDSIWMGNRDGLIVCLAHDGQIVKRFCLDKNIRYLLGNERHIYASSEDGNLYEMTGKTPRVVYKFRSDVVYSWRNFSAYSLNLRGDRLHIADIYGQISQLDSSQKLLWKISTGYQRTWFLESDDRAVYQGHNSGVAVWDIQTGERLWYQMTEPVICGTIAEDFLIIGTSARCLYQLPKIAKKTLHPPSPKRFAELDGAPYSCVFSGDRGLFFVADHLSYLYVFDRLGTRLGKYTTNCGAILQLSYFGDRLYGTTSDGAIACFSLDFSSPIFPDFSPNSNSEDRAAIVECFRVGNQLKVRPISPGYPSNRSVRFPRQLRIAGARYRVEELHEVQGKGYYIARGRIERIDNPD